MKKSNYFYITGIIIFSIIFSILLIKENSKTENINQLNVKVINSGENKLTVQDNEKIIYTFSVENNNFKVGDYLIIEYTGLLDKNKEYQNNTLINITPVSQDEENIIDSTNNIFNQFSILASDKVNEMTLQEKIGQILLVGYEEGSKIEAIEKYKVGGFIFFEENFKDKTKDQIKEMINNLQRKTKIPLLTAVDEEGGEVVRISSNKNIIAEKFKSPRELYQEGGFNLIKEDVKIKSQLLGELGINVNLAPVVDVSTNSNDYIYNRTLGENTNIVSQYAKEVIEANKGSNVSLVLKHFPGYGNNEDSHNKKVIDNRDYSQIKAIDIPPFQSGIESGAEAILVNHNVIKSIDDSNPASLSASVHNILRNDLKFTGVIMTDDLSMGAISSIENPVTKAILAGNDIIITTNYKESYNEIEEAVKNNKIDESLIDSMVHKIISWKYYKGIMYQKTK